MIVNETNWREAYDTDYSQNETVLIYIHKELFERDDRGITILENIDETHQLVTSYGDGFGVGYLRLYKKK